MLKRKALEPANRERAFSQLGKILGGHQALEPGFYDFNHQRIDKIPSIHFAAPCPGARTIGGEPVAS
jgi:hypothetical protein